MSETETKIHLVTDFTPTPKTPKITWLDWAKYYIYNTYRKPLVWHKQRELKQVIDFVKAKLNQDILPVLWEKRLGCNKCLDAYMSLKPQIFLSQIRSVLKILSRDHEHSHWPMFDSFLNAHDHAFEKSEEISAWINGFSK